MGVQETLFQPPPSKPALGAIYENELAKTVIEFAEQSEKLSLLPPEEGNHDAVAVEAQFVTPHDTVIITADGHRLPTVPVEEAHKLNVLREELEAQVEPAHHTIQSPNEEKAIALSQQNGTTKSSTDASLKKSMPPSHTNPLFPPLPLYGPPSPMTHIQCLIFRVTSFFLSLAFLAVIVLGALFTSIGPSLEHLWLRATFRNPDATRPFYAEELRRAEIRKEQEKSWTSGILPNPEKEEYLHTEGGPDPLVCDPAYYARRVGLDIEPFEVQTEDGFLIDLWHVYNPKEHTSLPPSQRAHRGPETFTSPRKPLSASPDSPKKFPVLLIHGLLQSSGAYCVNDDDSLAFVLAKAGYDVWLGNNRCGFEPKHTLLRYPDPRMWAWNIRQMGVFDLPALISRVCYETGFEKIGLICHSQGTTQALVALAKEQRPDLGEKLTVFCGLAPAAYAGPLIGKMYFKFMRVISPGFFRVMFGIHAFIPFMMEMHKRLDRKVYGWLGYKVFSFLFNWTDEKWDRGLRDRMFRFAPVYVSSESMRWWLGRECFAKHKCILATKEEWRAEEREDGEGGGEEDYSVLEELYRDMEGGKKGERRKRGRPKGSTAWYNEKVPPFALWVAGNDDLVDGHKLLRRFERGREPHVEVVHSKVIPEYEHLDVIWAMDAPEQVFKEVKEVLWKTCDVRDNCQVPKGCEDVPAWKPKKKEMVEIGEEELQSSSSEDLSP
ncbi:Alpha/Beta hydrolase protein [Triangularia setosa]|uniref:Alpha/Beta hydrolase protein n=1 Tax=Triangularia setosa TaxID=2587417 RepID=A0AAN6W0H7_9PEZI|nr:Alpha/Beta hydrolase protein [Podospora setosa]